MGDREGKGKGDKKTELRRMRGSSRDGVRRWDKEEAVERVREREVKGQWACGSAQRLQ